jgi:glycosyltransferase involved in cell wall biosynthesis
MKSLLIAGWRGVHHSFAMINQHQILALLKRSNVELFHHDMPLLMAHWNDKDHNPGFSKADYELIMSLQDKDEAAVDCVFRICAPMFPPSRRAKRTITFGITELGFDRASLNNPDQVLDEITNNGNLIITSTRWSRDRLIDFGFREDKVRVVTCGVDLTTFKPLTEGERMAQRAALNIPSDAVVFLNVGVPTWNKGVDLLIRTFARVHSQFTNTRLILKDARGLYGFPVDNVLQEVERNYPGLLTPSVIAAISVIPNNLTQLQLRSLYGLSDWYVSPYRAEGFNLPVLEAQACGTPVITSSGGSTDDFCSTPAVKKIATVFNRGPLGKMNDSCWVEPHQPALEELMIQTAKQGPCTASHSLRDDARKNAEIYSWDRAAEDLLNVIWE